MFRIMCKISGHVVKCEGQTAGLCRMSPQYLLTICLKIAKIVHKLTIEKRCSLLFSGHVVKAHGHSAGLWIKYCLLNIVSHLAF